MRNSHADITSKKAVSEVLSMQRLTAIVLFGTLLTALAIPSTVGRWQCFDGHACHYNPGKGFECRSLSSASQDDCCPREDAQPCQHGFLPHAVQRPSSSPSGVVGNTCCCQFVTLKDNRLTAVRPATSQPTSSVAILPQVIQLSLPSRATSLPDEDFFPRAREGPTLQISRAPPFA